MDYTGLTFCGVETEYRAGAQSCRFTGGILRWSTEGSLTGFDHLTLVAAGAAAWKMITDVCGLKVEYTSNFRTANVQTKFGALDGRGRILAQSPVMCGNAGPIQPLFDNSEDWVFADNPPSNKISLPATWCHESFHGIGLNGHLGPGNLMGTTYDPRILRPQSADINELVIRYGLPSPDVAPPTVPTPDLPPVSKSGPNVIDADGTRWRWVGWERVG